jgi:hypothetical protein
MTWIREKILLPKTINPTQRKKIAEVIISHIIDRSIAGYDKNNKKFPNYTKKYAEIKGVDVSDVDLLLSAEMLESIKLLSDKSGEITIGFDKSDQELNGKAEGNILGSYGREPNKKKARDFLGIDSDELDVLISAYENELDDNEIQLTDEEIKILSKELVNDMLDDL